MTRQEATSMLKELEKSGNIGNHYVLYEDDDGYCSISEFTDGLSYTPGLTEIDRVVCKGQD